MWAALRREYAPSMGLGAQFISLVAASKLNSQLGWWIAAGVIAVIALFSWRSALKSLRLIRDTPTSKVASAAQGYVELIGRGKAMPNEPVFSKFRQLPCLWFRYKLEQLSEGETRNEWRTVDSGESRESFMLCDSSGECVVDADYAEINTRYCEVWREGDLRYTEWTLLEHDVLYVLGAFRTHSMAAEFNRNTELNALLAAWKLDLPELHRRFDLNNDGELDMDEWLLARKAAQREVAKQFRAAQAQPDIHLVSQPADGKLFLISNRTPADLSRRYLYWCWLHLALFFISLAGLAWLLQAA
jgi:hypothetical protein